MSTGQSKAKKIPVKQASTAAGAKQLSRHAQQPARTLMRQAVHKPAAPKRHVKAVMRTDILARRPRLAVTHKPFITEVDDRRLKLAKHIRKSPLVSHFNLSGASNFEPMETPPAVASTVPAQAIHGSHPRVKHKEQSPTTEEFLERALQNATSHLEPALPKRRRLGLRRRLASH